MTIAICIATFARPAMLAALLRSLGTLALPASVASLLVVVVDNDADGSAEPVVRAAKAALPWPVVLVAEPLRNIARARNRAVAAALAAGAEWLAFVDDDEEVTPDWLAELLRVQAAYGADVVGGTVLNAYTAEVPRWFSAAALPDRRRHATGTLTDAAETSNALVARRVFEHVPGWFDERFGLSGGSDSHFFLRARAAGARIVWADDARVRETFGASRASAGWLLRRAFRTGNCAVLIARSMRPLPAWLPRRLAAAAYRVVRGLALLLPALARGRAAVVRALQDTCAGAGALAAVGGYRYVEYERTHGS